MSEAAASPIIEVVHVDKTYSTGEFEVRALQDVSISISAGECVAIMGPSGSGKSTLMNVIGCLDTPTSGTYRLCGLEVENLSEDDLAGIRSTRSGCVFQTFNLIPRTSAIDNVEMARLYNWRGLANRREAAMQCLESVGLGDRVSHTPSELSGGQQQRVAIARALVNNPLIILADEPTGALDSKAGAEIMAIFQRLNRQGKTVLLVTHDSDIAQYTKRIVKFKDGQIMSDEPTVDPIELD